MTDKIEIMARAICAEDGNDPDVNLWLVDAWHPRWWYNRKRAQAAIKALEANGFAIVPSVATLDIGEAMFDAVERYDGFGGGPEIAIASYNAAMAAIAAGSKPEAKPA